jgi:hypothetical protein
VCLLICRPSWASQNEGIGIGKAGWVESAPSGCEQIHELSGGTGKSNNRQFVLVMIGYCSDHTFHLYFVDRLLSHFAHSFVVTNVLCFLFL